MSLNEREDHRYGDAPLTLGSAHSEFVYNEGLSSLLTTSSVNMITRLQRTVFLACFYSFQTAPGVNGS